MLHAPGKHARDLPDPLPRVVQIGKKRKDRSARQKLKRGGGQANLAARAVMHLDMGALLSVLEEMSAAAAAAAAAAEARRQAASRNTFRHFFPNLGEAEELPEAPAPAGGAGPQLDGEAVRAVRQALVQNPDLEHLPGALALYYYDGELPDEAEEGRPLLPDRLAVVNTGCVSARLAHHPLDLDRRAPAPPGPPPAPTSPPWLDLRASD